VLSVETAPGALVGSGSPILILLDTAHLEFHTTNLSERDLAQISPGQSAVVTLKAYPDDPIEATVVRVGWQAGEPVGDAATFPVILSLNETDLDIRPGMTGRVEILRED
jgi:multidrug resistance efflux pump